MADEFEALGVSGLQRTGGMITDEFVKNLRGQRGAKTWREMSDNDPVVGALMFAIERLILQMDWRVDAYDGDDQNDNDHKEAEFVESCLHDMNHSFSDTLSDISTFLVYGYAFTEVVYKKRGGASDDPTQRSQYSDGRIGWRKWALRAQETTYEWMFDDDGGIRGMIQQDPNSGTNVTIPIERALLFRTSTARNNPEGRSLMRNAYRPWRFKKTIEEIEAIGIERDLAGLPVAHVPPSMLGANATSAEVAARSAIEQLVRGIKRNENEGVLFPLAYDEDGRKQYELTLLNAGGARQFDTDQIVGRYDQRIAMTVLGDFILLGHESVGSFALGASKIDLFTTAVSQIAQSVADVINSHAIPRLYKLNGLATDRLPRLVVSGLTHTDLATLGAFIQSVAGVGALTLDDNLDAHIRQVAGMPPRSENAGAFESLVEPDEDDGDDEA